MQNVHTWVNEKIRLGRSLIVSVALNEIVLVHHPLSVIYCQCLFGLRMADTCCSCICLCVPNVFSFL